MHSAKTCRWLITSLVGNVDLDIVFSDIEDDLPSRCDYDKYTINDGEWQSVGLIFILLLLFLIFIHRDTVLINVVFLLEGNDRCENNVVRTVCSQYPKVTPFTFTSSGSSVVVFFVSDSSVNRRGFLLKYKSNATYTTTTVTQTTESSSSQATTSSVEKSNKGVTNLSICWHTKMIVKAMLVQLLVGFIFFLDPNTCMDARMVIGIVFGSLVVVIFSVIIVVFMILRFHNLQKTIKPKDWNIRHLSLIYDFVRL